MATTQRLLLVLVAVGLLAAAFAATQDVIVHLRHKADLRTLKAQTQGLEKSAKGSLVFNTLKSTYSESQKDIVRLLESWGVTYRQYWIVNAIRAAVTQEQRLKLAAHSHVSWIEDNVNIRLLPKLPVVEPTQSTPRLGPQAALWNIKLVNADKVWAQYNITGDGVVVAGADTGYEWNHQDLKRSYRGWDGSTAQHNYNWFDGVDFWTLSWCGVKSAVPCDDNGHGTHTMGTMVGNDGNPAAPGWPESSYSAVGVAPNAQWISCRNMGNGDGRPSSYIACFEFFIAPTTVAGEDPDPTKAPHVINNSWGCTYSEGCLNATTIQEAVDATKAAGIVVVAAAGNSGPSCSSVNEPPAIHASAFAVAATDSQDRVASFSSRGPVRADGSNRLKPDISAPGVNVMSSYLFGTYLPLSGTSMASPHIAGVVALVISANPALAGQVDEIESIIERTAKPLLSSQCGSETPIPNPVYGYGRADALAAVELARLYRA